MNRYLHHGIRYEKNNHGIRYFYDIKLRQERTLSRQGRKKATQLEAINELKSCLSTLPNDWKALAKHRRYGKPRVTIIKDQDSAK